MMDGTVVMSSVTADIAWDDRANVSRQFAYVTFKTNDMMNNAIKNMHEVGTSYMVMMMMTGSNRWYDSECSAGKTSKT